MLRPSLSIGLEYFYFMNYEQFIESIITDKPISKIGYINKKNIHVVNEEVKLIQFKYRSHLIIKKLKEEREKDIILFQNV